MKRALLIITSFALWCTTQSMGAASTNSLSISDSEYTNVRFQRIEGDQVVLFHSVGIARVPIKSLSDDQRRMLGIPTRAENLRQEREIEAFAAQQRSKGLVLVNNRWLRPDELPTIDSRHDDIQAVTWYSTKRDTGKKEGNTSYSISVYVGKHDSGSVNFRFRSRYFDFRSKYHDTRWIFYESVHLLADNGARLTVTTEYPEKKQDNDSYGLEEWSDNFVDAERVLPFAGARRIQVMFKGKYSNTFDMTSEQLQALQEMIALYRYLTKEQRTKP